MTKPLSIDRNLIEHLGELARLSLPADKEAQLRAQLERLVAAFSALGTADFGDGDAAMHDDAAAAPPASEPALTPESLRPDVPGTPPDVREILANAPQSATDCFVVPRVVEP